MMLINLILLIIINLKITTSTTSNVCPDLRWLREIITQPQVAQCSQLQHAQAKDMSSETFLNWALTSTKPLVVESEEHLNVLVEQESWSDVYLQELVGHLEATVSVESISTDPGDGDKKKQHIEMKMKKFLASYRSNEDEAHTINVQNAVFPALATELPR